MQGRIILRFAVRDQSGERPPAPDLHDKSICLIGALLEIEETEGLSDVSTSSDASLGTITVEAVTALHDSDSDVRRLEAIVDTILASLEDSSTSSYRLTYERQDASVRGIPDSG